MFNIPLKYKEFLRYTIVGTVATGIHYGVYYLLQKQINVNIAYTIGYLASFIFNYFGTSYFTFKVKLTIGKLFGLSGAHGINYLMHVILLNLFLCIGISKVYAPMPVFVIVIPLNFIIVRFVFKNIKI